ncbi:MAG: phosphatidylglycerol lysyltransferase domain-containing protein [Treponema sp.]|jgi:hypothetical protein|nr:phosphatidylglycerol lysyltransferase domain-containing protein [Treponema sp.]
MSIPLYPDFAPLDLEAGGDLHPRLSLTADGVSEFTFSGLYLFRNRYRYRVAKAPGEGFIVSGEQPTEGHPSPGGDSGGGKKFFMTPCASPGPEILAALFETHDYWKNIGDSVLAPEKENLTRLGIEIAEDRDNFDYLYLRSDLAELAGKKFHKKKNLVNAFHKSCPNHDVRPLTAELIPQAMEVLDRWRADKGGEGDYRAAREALELFGSLKLRGSIFFVDGAPAGWCLGESIAKGKMFAIHFEKAVDGIKGIYQYMNQAFAASLPRFFTYLNREQDLGDEGLRQAKETYRPCGFVKKYRGIRHG